MKMDLRAESKRKWVHSSPKNENGEKFKCGLNRLKCNVEDFSVWFRNNSYHFFRTNQRKVNLKSHSLTQFNLTMNVSDWHILAGNDKRIVLHCLIRVSGSLFTSFSALQLQFNHLGDSSKSKGGTFNENSCLS